MLDHSGHGLKNVRNLIVSWSAMLIIAVLLLMARPLSAAPVVELFTSQGCYSCPAADEFLADLIEAQPDLVALEYHVDYWDDLVYGAAGQWKDPFSDPAYTLRQRNYNQHRLQGKRGVYTPQMVINGATAQVGSDRKAVLASIPVRTPPLQLGISNSDANQLRLNIEGEDKSVTSAAIWLATFDKKQVTQVSAGENKGEVLTNHHVVRSLTKIGTWKGGSQSLLVPMIEPADSGCAVFIQQARLGRILGAINCP